MEVKMTGFQPKRDQYQPFYCEENVWQLIHQGLVSDTADILFITNEWKQVVLAGQKAGDENGIVIWDYHVVVLTDDDVPMIWDWDSRGPTPMAATRWFLTSLAGFCAHTPEGLAYRPELIAYAPVFRLIPAAKYALNFSSDRRHMKDEAGDWLQPPPVWNCIGEGHNLDQILDVSDPEWGAMCDLNSLYQRMGFD